MPAIPMVLAPTLTLKDPWRMLVSAEVYEKAQLPLDRIIELLAPLVIIDIPPGGLRFEVNRRYRTFVDLKYEFVVTLSLSLAQASPEEVANLLKESTRFAVLSADAMQKYIPQPACSQFFSAMESYAELVESFASSALLGDWGIINSLMRCWESLNRFDMVSLPVLLTIQGVIEEYAPRNLAMLARAADRYMVEVEDVFIAHRLESGASDGETISLDRVRERLGL